MRAAIVDTDVASMLFKGDTRALAYRGHVTGRLLGIFHDAGGTGALVAGTRLGTKAKT
jgi:hypothetical protein